VNGKRPRIVGLAELLRDRYPDLADAEAAIRDGTVDVDGAIVMNPRSRVRSDAVIRVRQPRGLRGAAKLIAALDRFDVDVAGRAALDLGAATGGFTDVLLRRGARVVYAVDAGFGQLLGSLRQDARVRNLERTNLADLTLELVPDGVDVVTIDLSYLSVASAIGQVEGLRFAPDADLIALVKPMFELGLGRLPTGQRDLDAAVERAASGVQQGPWSVRGVMRSPVSGSRGAIEFLLHAVRAEPDSHPETLA
jgi:23S rRNA (cytidine1920-2'-O)/16S rRNA (cytidine1409-2'-O)-methyltransferase